jgi:hypothetical protein
MPTTRQLDHFRIAYLQCITFTIKLVLQCGTTRDERRPTGVAVRTQSARATLVVVGIAMEFGASPGAREERLDALQSVT